MMGYPASYNAGESHAREKLSCPECQWYPQQEMLILSQWFSAILVVVSAGYFRNLWDVVGFHNIKG